MKKKINSKHIFDNNDDARRFYKTMKAADYRRISDAICNSNNTHQ